MTTDMHDFESPWQTKVWGSVQHVFNSPDVAVSVLKVKAGFRCSRHLHVYRINKFVVVSGKIAVHEWSCVADLEDHYGTGQTARMLRPGQEMSVPVGIPHMFEVIEDGIVVEIYTPDGGPVDADDIVRFDEGGPV